MLQKWKLLLVHWTGDFLADAPSKLHRMTRKCLRTMIFQRDRKSFAAAVTLVLYDLSRVWTAHHHWLMSSFFIFIMCYIPPVLEENKYKKGWTFYEILMIILSFCIFNFLHRLDPWGICLKLFPKSEDARYILWNGLDYKAPISWVMEVKSWPETSKAVDSQIIPYDDSYFQCMLHLAHHFFVLQYENFSNIEIF